MVIEKNIYVYRFVFVYERHVLIEGSSPGVEYVEGNDTIEEETIQVVMKYTHAHVYRKKKEKKSSKFF